MGASGDEPGRVDEALGIARRWKQFCAHRGAIRHLIRWNLLSAQLLLMHGDLRAAQRSLREALIPAAEGGQARIFLDEGPVIHDLLAESYGRGPLTKHPADIFAHNLLSALEGRQKTRVADEADQRPEDDVGLGGKIDRTRDRNSQHCRFGPPQQGNRRPSRPDQGFGQMVHAADL